MKKSSFCSGWTVSHIGDEANARPVSLPHDAMLSEKRTGDSAGGTNTGWFEGWDYRYKKQFFVPEEWKKQCTMLWFEGVYHRCEIWINGKKAGYFPNGYIGFGVELAPYLKFGAENTVEVIARNADQPNSRWYSGAGIYRPVWLYEMPQGHILPNGISMKTLDTKTRSIEIFVEANFSGRARVEILDGETVLGKAELLVDKTGVLRMSLPQAKLWSMEHPTCYTCRVSLGEDQQETRFGIRTVTCDAENGFLLNGKRVILRGACVHHDNGLLGAAAEPYAEWRKIRLLLKNGYNAVRSAHNPCSDAMLEACDALGMLVVDEYADMWYIHKTKYDYASCLEKEWKQDLGSLVRRDQNHPSVVMYSIGNEVSETAQKKGIELCRQMTEYLHEKDNRPVTCGVNIFFNFLSSMGFGVYSDKKAEREVSAKKNGKAAKKKAVGSEFFNNLAGLLGADFMKFGATLHGSDRKTRDAYAVLDAAGYNYGINRYEKDLKKYPNRVILGSETFCSDTYRFWKLAKKHPALIGDFVWSGIDYLGEVGIGAWEYPEYCKDFSHGPGWIAAGAGRIDLTGKAHGEMAYTRVAYELDPIRMAVYPVCFDGGKHSPSAWRMSNALESWSWEGCEGKTAQVEVYARGAKAALYLNGKLLEEKAISPKDCLVKFQIPYQKGELKAVSCDAAGKKLAETSLKTASEETVLGILPEESVLSGKDALCYARLAYTDQNGIVKPMARGKMQIKVQGGTLLAFGNACAYYEGSYQSDTTDSYYGEALAIIRPDGSSKIRIQAESPYGSAAAEVEVRP